jgi:VWFA-related protein
VTLLQDWTRSRTQFRRALGRVTPGMFTRFNDALYLSAREQFRAGGRHRRAVVVLTDGIDSGRGSVTAEGALKALLESQAAVYVIGNTEIERARKRSELASLLDARGTSPGMNELKVEDLREGLRVLDASEGNLGRLCDATGGKFYRPQSFDALGNVYAEVADELRSQYALYYAPLDKGRDGKFRRVEVRTRDGSLRVSARVGYYAPRG